MREENRIEFGKTRFGFAARRISWSAVLAGVAVAFGVAILLGLLGAGLGASSVNPLQERNPFEGLATGALIWMIVSGIIAFFIGGWLAAYGGWSVTRAEALTHGLVMWAVATLVGFSLMTDAGLAGLGARAASPPTELGGRIQEELEKRGVTSEPLRGQDQTPQAQAQTDQRARETGQAVAHGVSKAALGGFTMLLLNLIASLLGALTVGHRRRWETVTTERVA